VGVRLLGESFGVKNENGIIEVSAHSLLLRCLPKDLPEFVEVDVTELHVNQSIHVSELKKIAGVEILDKPGLPVVSCGEPPAEEVVATVAAAPVEGALAEGAVPAEGAAGAPAAGAAGAAVPAAGAKGAAPAAGAKGAAPAAGAAGAAAPAAGAKGAAPAAGAKGAASGADKKASGKK